MRPTLVALLLTLALPTVAHATLARPFPLAELVRASHSIVRGEVVDQESVWDAAWGEVYTLSWVRVDEVLEGRERVGELVVVRQIGGVIDGVERRVVGVAPLTLGDEVVVFARTDGTFHYLVGMAQGAFHVQRGPSVRVLRGGLPGLVASAGPMRPLAPDAAGWSEFRGEVMRLVTEARP